MLSPSAELNILRSKIRRQDQVISAMQRRDARNPVRNFFIRKPWKASPPKSGDNLRATLYNYWSWLKNAHDCFDKSVGCSCHPSYRFPEEF